MKIDILIRNLFFILFALYYAQGIFYPKGTFMSQFLLFMGLSISSFYFFKLFLLKVKKPFFYIAWTFFFLLNVLGYIFTGSLYNPIHLSMFKGILVSFMPFYPFYYFVFKELITSKILTYYFILMLPIIILQYFLNEQYLINELDKDIVVNNLAYAFVSLIPFTFLFKKKILAYGAILILFYFIISSSKRGAIITGSAGLIFFMYNQIRTLKIKNRWKGYLISLLSFFVLIYFIFNFLEANELLTERIEHMREGDSSGRDIIYTNIFNNWYNDNSIIHFLFGYGFASSIELSGFGILAHNDWLELLSNFGLLGICVYLFFFYSGFSSIKNNTWDVNRKITMLATLSMWLLTSFFSMGYSSDIGFFRVVLIAYLIGFSENNNKFRKNENSLFYR